ncbi:hypothetical protein HDV03_001679 [Kappamyces sp. JEL0829]|nr:hypothetical protein HDV03_001679 [Kappamyces sp. JEL0829]
MAHGVGADGSRLRKRGFWGNLWNGIKEVGTTVVDGVVQVAHTIADAVHSDWDKTGVIPFNINYDPASQTVKKPLVPILDISQIKLDCINCHTKGQTTIELHLKATLMVVTEYTLTIDGDLYSNLDFDMTIKEQDNNFLKRKNLFSLPLSPFSVPGVFNFGPEVLVDAAVSYSVTKDIDLQFGFDAHIPFHVVIDSPKGFLSAPQVSKDSKPSVNGHPFVHSKDIQVGVGAHLIPALALDLSVFSLQVVGMQVELDSSIGAELNLGSFTKCPEDKFDITLYHQHQFAFEYTVVKAFHNRYNILDSGKLPIADLFTHCNNNVTTPTSSALASSTAVKITSSTSESATSAPSSVPSSSPPASSSVQSSVSASISSMTLSSTAYPAAASSLVSIPESSVYASTTPSATRPLYGKNLIGTDAPIVTAKPKCRAQ